MVGAVLLDLTAAFDLLDHCLLGKKLEQWFWITGINVSFRSQQVHLNGGIYRTLGI